LTVFATVLDILTFETYFPTLPLFDAPLEFVV